MKALPLDRALLPDAGNLAYGAQRSATHVHRGVDLPRKLGTPVYAVADGRVEHAAPHWEQGFSGYGGHVVIAHADGTRALYAHLASVATAKGRTVYAGEQIGTVGRTTGTQAEPTKESGGAHLHMEISPRAYPQPSEATRLNPAEWLGAAIEPRIARAIASAARASGVEIALLRAIAWIESQWNPVAESARGVGLMGLNASRARELGIDPLNPEQAASAAALLVAQALRRYESVASALAAYVWGIVNVDAHPESASWPAAVELYVHEVIGRWGAERTAIPFAQPGADGGSRQL